MEIIPAIDIIGGKSVRLTKGDYKMKKVYKAEPLATAKLFESRGIKRLHLIDLEGAKQGKVKNWATIENIAKNTELQVQFGGGVHNLEDIERLLALGIGRVILGSLAVREPERLGQFLKKFGAEKIVVDVGVKQGEIYFKGWQEKAGIALDFFLKKLLKLGVKLVICTDIERDGALQGPNFLLYKRLLKDFPDLRIIASGGIRNRKDLEKLSELGLGAAVVGKAIHEGKISLSDLASFSA